MVCLLQDTWYPMKQGFFMTRLYWVEDLTQPVLNVCIKLNTGKEHWKMSVLEGKKCCSKRKKVLIENNVNIESNILDLTI